MNRLIFLLSTAVSMTACMSTATEISDNTYRIETIEFPHSIESNGFEYAKTEWMRRAEELCGEKTVKGSPRYKNTIDGKTMYHASPTEEKLWIVAFGKITCV